MKQRFIEVRRVNVKKANELLDLPNHEHWEPIGPSGGAVLMGKRMCGHPEWARQASRDRQHIMEQHAKIEAENASA